MLVERASFTRAYLCVRVRCTVNVTLRTSYDIQGDSYIYRIRVSSRENKNRFALSMDTTCTERKHIQIVDFVLHAPSIRSVEQEWRYSKLSITNINSVFFGAGDTFFSTFAYAILSIINKIFEYRPNKNWMCFGLMIHPRCVSAIE